MTISSTIQTERLLLRPHRESDADDVLSYASDPQWQRFLPVPRPYTRQDAIEYLTTVSELDKDQHPSWAVCLEDAVIGGVNLRFFHDHRIAEAGYGLAPSHWGKGMTTEVMRKVCTSAFDTYPQLQRIRARAIAENIGSRRVMQKLGMVLEGVMRRDRLFFDELRDEAVYGVLRDEWTR